MRRAVCGSLTLRFHFGTELNSTEKVCLALYHSQLIEDLRKYVSALSPPHRWSRRKVETEKRQGGNKYPLRLHSGMPRRIPSRYCVSDRRATRAGSENFHQGLLCGPSSIYALKHPLPNGTRETSGGAIVR